MNPSWSIRNPETVSTDYDTSDKLFFEPLTREDVLHIIDTEKPMGLIVQFGGQTPLNLAVPLAKAGARILGTSPDAIDRAEDRERFKELLAKLNLKQPDNGTATDDGPGPEDCPTDQLSCGGAAFLCAGRPGHANCG